MHSPGHLISRIGSSLIALGASSLTGATLAVLVVEGRLSALNDLFWRAGWIMHGRPLVPGEADATWLLEAEWLIAFKSSLWIAIVGSIVWTVVGGRKLQCYRGAAVVGFVLSAGMAAIWLNQERGAILQILSIGLLGAAMGLLTRTIDQALRLLSRAQ